MARKKTGVKKLLVQFATVLSEIPELTYVGNKVLRKKALEVAPEGARIGRKLKKVLRKYRKVTGLGRGLAAPQIGESKAVFVTYFEDEFTVYINPQITWRSKKNNCYREGCISSGIFWVDVKRPASIKIRYTDEKGKTKEEKAGGFPARLLQHEYDHLQGIVNLDKAIPGTIELMGDPLKEKLRKC